MVEVIPRTGLLVPVETPQDSGVRTIPLGGTDAEGNPLPPTGTYYVPVPGGKEGVPVGLVPYVESQAPAAPGPGGAPAGLVPYQEPQGPQQAQQAQQAQQGQKPMGAVPAAGYGALHGATFGAYPALAGLAGASGLQTGPPKGPDITVGAPDQSSTYQAMQEGIDTDTLGALGRTIAAPFVGGYKLATEQPTLSDLVTGGTEAQRAYTKGREDALKEIERARTDQPGAFLAGEVAGSAATIPAMGPLGSLRAPTVLGRVAQSGKVGGVTGGAFGAGEATSRGESPVSVLKEGAKGAAVGAPLGAVLGGTIETGAHVLGRVGQIRRAYTDPEGEAYRQLGEALRGGRAARERMVQDQPALRAGQEAGTPLVVADVGGQSTRRALRTATTRSPEGQETAGRVLTQRFQGQAERVSEWILSRFGGGDVGRTLEQLQNAARRANAPNYRRAQAAADRRFPQGVWSQRSTHPDGRGLEELLGTQAVQKAMQKAIETGGDASVLEGLGAFNPRVTFENGMLRFNTRGGVRAFPDLQLWDYTQRALRDMALAAPRGSNEARILSGLQRELLAELDRLVPEFGHARGVAARFFGASDALQAGEDFVSASRVNGRRLRDPEVARQVASMSPEERALFQYGFSTQLANLVRGAGDSRNVVNQIAASLNARRRIEIALGRDGAEELQSLLRLEGLIDRTRTAAMGNSITSQNLHDLGAGVAGGIGASWNPAYWIAGALILSGRQTAHEIDQGVATRLAEMLVSEDPAIFQRGLQIVTQNPVIRDAFRRASDLSQRELFSALGPGGVAAGVAVGGQKLLPGASAPQPPPHPPEQRREDENQ